MSISASSSKSPVRLEPGTYLCPHCHQVQTDACINTDGTYLGCTTTDIQCPNCYGMLGQDELDQLDAVQDDDQIKNS